MKKEREIRNLSKEILKGMVAFLCTYVEIMGAYPFVPAFFASCSVVGRASVFVMVGAVAGMYCFMTMEAMLKYVFVLLVIGLGIKMYIWSNRFCNNWIVAVFAGCATTIMNYAGNAFYIHQPRVLLEGACEGLMVFGLSLCMHYLARIPFLLNYILEMKQSNYKYVPSGLKENQTHRMESFSYAVNGLSDAFMMLSQPKEKHPMEEVSALEQELTGKLCASCDGCAICWNENRMKRQGGIRALLHAVINHSTKEELLSEPYMNDCYRYENMVDEAIQAFGRLELNYAWYNRLCENRYVIAQQLDAMAGLMEEWAKSKINVDKKYKSIMAQIAYEVREKGSMWGTEAVSSQISKAESHSSSQEASHTS